MLSLGLSLMQVMQDASFCLSPKSTLILTFAHATFPLTQDTLTILVRPSFIVVSMYRRYSLPSAPERDPETSLDSAYHLDGQHVDGPSTEEQDLGPTSEPQASYTWLPPTLKGSDLQFLFGVTLLPSGVVFYFTRKSVRHHGICDNKDSTTTFLSWRFLPNLVATVYSLLVANLAIDVRRTEIFARLSNTDGASAAYTVCMPTRSWWNDPFDA
jgi:hypothetical protein